VPPSPENSVPIKKLASPSKNFHLNSWIWKHHDSSKRQNSLNNATSCSTRSRIFESNRNTERHSKTPHYHQRPAECLFICILFGNAVRCTTFHRFVWQMLLLALEKYWTLLKPKTLDSSVTIVTRLGIHPPRSWNSCPCRSKRFLSSRSFRTVLGSTQHPVQCHLGSIFVRVKRQELWTRLPPPSNVEDKNIRSHEYNFPPTTPSWDGTELSLGRVSNLHKTKAVKIIWFSSAWNVEKGRRHYNCVVLHYGVQVKRDWMTIQAIWVNISIIDINPSLAQQFKKEKEEEEAVAFDLRCFTSPIHRVGL
jgi:hypothetical protein